MTQKIVEKVDATGSTARLPGSGRPISVRTVENIAEVEGLVFSQEDQDTSDLVKHDSPRVIALKLGIPRRSVKIIAFWV